MLSKPEIPSDWVLPTGEEIDEAFDALHLEADEDARIHEIPAFRYLSLEE